MEQQHLIDRIIALAIAISLNPDANKFITASYDGPANQLSITFISRRTHKHEIRSIGLHEPGEPAISRERVNRMLREELTNLISLHRKCTLPQQRRMSL